MAIYLYKEMNSGSRLFHSAVHGYNIISRIDAIITVESVHSNKSRRGVSKRDKRPKERT